MRTRAIIGETNTWRRVLAVAGLAVSLAHGQGGRPEPKIGYLYPAGACRGTTIEVLAGGQALKDVKQVRVSGEGVTARVIRTYRGVRNLNGEQRQMLQWRIACRRAEIHGRKAPPAPEIPEGPDGKPAKQFQLPEMPFLDMLDHLDAEGIEHWTTVMQRKDRMQQNNQLGELVRIELHVAEDAPQGMREIRFGGPQGLTSPMRFEISDLPEHREVEPNEAPESDRAAATIPCVFNGQIQAGDVDIFRFRARRDDRVVVRGEARSLIPYLADAVPGWFQMVVTIRDPEGNEIAYGDDYRFDPDPALCFRAPEDGEYTLEVRDSIYRGREDFVYRVH
ncbi:MAG: hypothetical protein KDN05_08090, partial [Verrucomicrobiae bacterium]|nr:hypothetical protein [Verrucomicrobiae bacterium]